ncbi:MAG: hypothetical protein QOC57_1632, partial [Ilumatobacteraceae bacterium]
PPDQQTTRFQRVSVVGVTDHLGKRSIAKGEHRPKGSQEVADEATATLACHVAR